MHDQTPMQRAIRSIMADRRAERARRKQKRTRILIALSVALLLVIIVSATYISWPSTSANPDTPKSRAASGPQLNPNPPKRDVPVVDTRDDGYRDEMMGKGRRTGLARSQ